MQLQMGWVIQGHDEVIVAEISGFLHYGNTTKYENGMWKFNWLASRGWRTSSGAFCHQAGDTLRIRSLPGY